MTKKNKKLKQFLKYARLVIILLFIGYGIIWCLTTSTSEEQECKEQGYEGGVTMFGIPVHQCFIDNRLFKQQVNKIEFYPLE